MTFHQPSVWFLLLLLIVPLLWWRWSTTRYRSGVAFSSIRTFSQLPSTWAVRMRWIVPALRCLALTLLIVAMARPQKGDEHARISTEGVAIQLIVDRSGSMRAMDFRLDGKPVDRLAAVKRVVQDFVAGDGELAGRPNDLIGMIAFASFADTVCPMTSDHSHLVDSIKQVTVASEREESATAIGDAIALGVERLQSIESRLGVKAAEAARIKSKLIILLTDGENNAGDIDPRVAAQMAATTGIKVYTIGAGTKEGFAPVPGTNVFGQQMQIPVSIDEESLTEIAQLTGGQYFRATDTDSLKRIYEQIDQMEKTKVQERRYVTYQENAVQAVAVKILDRAITVPPLLMLVLLTLALELFLSQTRFRTVT